MKTLVLAAAVAAFSTAALAQSSTTPESADVTCAAWNGLDANAQMEWADTFSTTQAEATSTGATNADASVKYTGEQIMNIVVEGCTANAEQTVNDVLTAAKITPQEG